VAVGQWYICAAPRMLTEVLAHASHDHFRNCKSASGPLFLAFTWTLHGMSVCKCKYRRRTWASAEVRTCQSSPRKFWLA